MRRSARRDQKVGVQSVNRSAHRRFRLAATLLAFLTFTCQSYLIQTHIHGLPKSLVMLAGGEQFVLPIPAPDTSPLSGDPADCPLCQDFVIAGSYLVPLAIIAPPPAFVFTAFDLPVTAAHPGEQLSHIWQGRAPPHA
ncbi:MAG: hypothetical protein KGJ79_02795 [Alphaproteobacteria bacterium]|nr:hypothetical protein [Alphaproteobacteria bacterium]